MGEGEQHEGTIWEAAMAAPHFKLGNLVAFVDRNGLCLDGPTEEIMALEPFADKWRAFNWRVIDVDGNNTEALIDVIDQLPPAQSDTPTLIIAKTTKGFGVDYMENQVQWHFGQISDEMAEEAIASLEAVFNRKWGDK